MSASATHPSTDQLRAFVLGHLDPEEQAELERHVAECELCCEVLVAVPNDNLLDRLRSADSSVHCPLTHVARAEGGTLGPEVGPPLELVNHPRYRIVKKLGAGGMGVVYQAEHRMMERTVALKVISQSFTSNPKAVERFRQEVRAAARLSHPNIVTAHDAEQAGDLHFLVMEFVEGVSLAYLVQQCGPLPAAHACNCALQAANGLQHAHQASMVHRDIKPHNLMLTPPGQIKILDFGLARLARETVPEESTPTESLAPSAAKSPSLTEIDVVVGTPDYMAPEQAKSSRVDIRADIYSLGCTLYYLLTGQAPFADENTLEKLFAHSEQAPRALAEFRDELPAGLAQVVARMMAKDPTERYQTPAEAAAALAPFAARTARGPGEIAPAGDVDLPAGSAGLAQGDTFPLHGRVQETPPELAPDPARPALEKHGQKIRITAAVLLGLATFGLASLAMRDNREPAASLRAKAPAPQTGKLPAPATGPQPKIATEPQVKELPAPATQPTASPRGLPVLFVLAQEFNIPDYVSVRYVLEKQYQVPVQVASSHGTDCKGKPSDPAKISVRPDLVLNQEVNAGNYSAVVIPGGYIWQFKDDTEASRVVGKLLRDMLQANKPVAALASGQRVLLAHGVLQGRLAADNFEARKEEEFRKGRMLATRWDPRPVVVDGCVITGGQAKDGPELARTLRKYLR